MNLKLVLSSLAVGLLAPADLFAEQGEDSPTGVSGIFTSVTTGGLYDPYVASAQRQVDDIPPIPGSVGKYPLHWSRWFNSHVTWRDNQMGGAWRFSYLDYKHPTSSAFPPCTPDGRRISPSAYGVEEYVDNNGLHLADGGRVVFNTFGSLFSYPVQIIDPYGQITTLSWVVYYVGGSPSYKLDTVTEPGGRYLKINWDSTNSYINTVQAFDGVNSQPIQTVTYTWSNFTLASGTVKVITGVTYTDGTSAAYTYTDQGYPGAPDCVYHQTIVWHVADLATASDVRYNGPMRQMAYQYYAGNGNSNKTRILTEKNFVTADVVSTITGVGNNFGTTTATETRGDGATRTLTYYSAHACLDCPPPDTDACPEPSPTDGKLSSFTDFLGHTTNLTYETDILKPSAGFITAVTDPNGHTTSYTRQTGSWGITTITHPDGSTIQQTYWPNSSQTQPYYLASRTDELGHTTNYTRDSNNRITRKDYPDGGWETFTYNSFGEVLVHARGKDASTTETESFAYDARGLKTSYTDPLNNVTTYTYYGANDPVAGNAWTDRLKTVTYPANASAQVASETYEYDRAFVNGLGTGAPVAGRGLVTKVTHADSNSITKVYDIYGQLNSVSDELGHTTSYTYDSYGRVLTIADPLGHTVTYSYLPTGQTSSYITTSKTPFSTTLPSGKVTTFEYDANWRKTYVHQAPNTSDAANMQFVYDAGTSPDDGSTNIGRLTSTIDPRNNATTYAYDRRDRQIRITDALSHTTSFTFDVHGNKTTETHANGEVITYDQYDPMNRLLHKKVQRDNNTPPTIDQTSMSYDLAGNQTSFTDEDGNLYSYTYDLMNRRLSMIYPDTTKHEDTTYDAAGNVATYRNRAANVQTFSYDNRNRQTYFSWNDGGTTPWQSTAYDAASRVTQIANTISTINHTFLNDNRLSTQEEWTSVSNDNVHRTVTYTYDADGNRATVQYPSGTLFNYNYTQRNQVSSIADSTQHHIVDYTYDTSGNITNRALDNGTSTAYTVDTVNRDTAVAHSLVGTTRRFDYAYNSVNDITAVQRDSANGDGFTYDLTQEITGFQREGTSVNLSNGTVTGGTPNSMVFDGCGNRTTLNGVNTTFNNMNQPTGTGITYENKGNLRTYNGWTYTYDAQNRLITATNGTTTANFKYDGKNRQVSRSITGSAIAFSVWDDWELVEEYTTASVRTAAYLQGAHGPIKSLIDNIYFYQDELGSTSHIASSTGVLLEYYKYDLNGKPQYWKPNPNPPDTQLSASAYNIRDLFTGERYVTELSLYDLRNRYVSPDLARFLQPDPIGFKGDASNLYRYCGNDWANKTDPTGLVDLAAGALSYVAQKASWELHKQSDSLQKQLDHLQAILNLKISVGMGATQIAGLVNKIQQLQQSIKALSLQLGQVNAIGAGPGVHIAQAGNWGNRGDPGYYQDGPLVGAAGQPTDKPGVTIAKLKDLQPHDDGSVSGTLSVDSHLLRCHKGDQADTLEQEHPQAWKDFYKGLPDSVTRRFWGQQFSSGLQAAQAKATYISNRFNEEWRRQNIWDMPKGRHDLSIVPPELLNPCP